MAEAIAHGHQSGVLRQVITHIGVQHLINDHAAHHEAHGGAEREDETDGGAALPVVLLEIDEALLGQHRNILGQSLSQSGHHLLRIRAGLQPHQTHFDRPRRLLRHQIEERLRAREQVAVGTEAGAQAHQTRHPDAVASDLGFHHTAIAIPIGNGSEFRT